MSDSKSNPGIWRVAVDIGGTFTDLVAINELTGATIEAKASTTPADYAAGVIDALVASGVDPTAIAKFMHGTTVVINAITQRTGVKTALVTTAGFRDALAIGRGNRPDMYNLKFHKPEPFVPRSRRFEVRERVAADGRVLEPLRCEDLDAVVARCRAEAVEAIAICFLHAYAHPAHERAAAAFLRDTLPGVAVSVSHEIVREWREYERTSTTVLNAYVQPILDRYLEQLEQRLRAQGAAARLFAMRSNGGSATFDLARRHPVQLVESGPAGGVIGAAIVGAQIGESKLITLDIGGTTAKCSLIEDGEITIASDYRLEWTPTSPGYPVKAPVVDIVEIGAGGGSIAWFDAGGAMRVGPRSAGSVPGPACYGHGGTEPTVTDAQLIAGMIDPGHSISGELTLHPELARTAYAPIAARLGCSIEEAAIGVLRVINEATIDALKLVSVRRGFDPRDFALVAFGGGGPLHAAHLGRELGVKQVIIPPRSGTFSAWGMLMANPRVDLVQTLLMQLDDLSSERLDIAFQGLEAEAGDAFAEQGFAAGVAVTHRRSVDARYHGQEHTVRVPVSDGPATIADLAAAFHALHERAYTFALPDTKIEIVNIRTISVVAETAIASSVVDATGGSTLKGTRLVDFGDGVRREAAVYARSALPAGTPYPGPAVIEEASSTTIVLPDQEVIVDPYGNLVIAQERSGQTRFAAGSRDTFDQEVIAPADRALSHAP